MCYKSTLSFVTPEFFLLKSAHICENDLKSFWIIEGFKASVPDQKNYWIVTSIL